MTQSTGQRTSRKGRVSWTDPELQAVIEEAVLIAVEDTEHIWSYLAQAQEQVLPANRHRRIGGKHVVTSDILTRFVKARREFLDQTKQPAEEAEASASASVPAPAPPVDRAAIIESITNAEIFDLVARRLGPFFAGIQAFAGVVETHIRKSEPEVETLAPVTNKQAVPPALTTVTPAPPTKIKVLLFGFDGTQEVEIRQRAANFDLELFFAFQELGKPVPPIPVCDWCIVKRPLDMTRRAKEALSRRPGIDRQINAGSADTALQKLADLNSRRKKN